MTCISKMPRNSTQPECDHRLVIEQALVSAVDQTLRPLDYEKRQREAREILLKSHALMMCRMRIIICFSTCPFCFLLLLL